MRHKGRLSDKGLKANVHGKLLGTFIGSTKFSAPRICYLLRNKKGDRFVIPRNFYNTGIFMADRVTCDLVHLVENIDVPAQEWENLLVQEVLRSL